MSSETTHAFTDEDVARFHEDGYVIKRSLFALDEVRHVNEVVKTDPSIREAVYGLADTSGATTELALWRHLGDDIFAAIARSRRIVDNLERVLGGEVSFFHSKLTLKRPKVGGAWDWHQDFGYWYRSGYLRPDMASVFVALDPSMKENGCLQVLKGSHKLGRIEHGVTGGQVGADMRYVDEAMKVYELVYAEMQPGDALFFHANLLHASSANTSERTRNVLLSCYSRSDNAPFMEDKERSHSSIAKLADDALTAYRDRPIDADRAFSKAPAMA